MPAVSVHHTATTDGDWNGPQQVAALSEDATQTDFENLFAWEPADLDDRKSKSNWKMPHHDVVDGKPGAANVQGCITVIEVLNGSMGGSDIPEADRKGVYDHVAAHLKDAGKEPAALKSLPEIEKEQREAAAAADGEVQVEARGEIMTPPALVTSTQSAVGTMRTHKGAMAVHRQRFLDGDPRAARALFLDAIKLQVLNTPFHEVDIRAKADGTGGNRLLFTGYASVTEAPYEMWDWCGPYTEIVRQGAFAKTLAEGCDTAFLTNHSGVTMARTKVGTMRLVEDDTGLYVEADLDPDRSDVGIIVSGIRGGELDEMSFAFWITRGLWSPDYEQYDLLELNLDKGDTSIVNYGANPHTSGLVGLRSRQLANLARSGFPGLVREAYKRRTGDHLDPADLSAMLHIVGLATGSDDTPEETRAILSQILGERTDRSTGAAQTPAGRENTGEPTTGAEVPTPQVPVQSPRERLLLLGANESVRNWSKSCAAQLREGKSLSAATLDVLTSVLDLIAQADEAVDAAQPMLADLMGVPNPDEADAQDPDGDEPDEGDDDDVDDVQGTQQSNAHSLDLYTRQLEALKLTSPALASATRTRL